MEVEGIRAQMKSNIPSKKYGQRNLIETVFSVVERSSQHLHLILGLAYNLFKL